MMLGLTHSSGCTKLAIVDLKEAEAKDAAAELVSSACGSSFFCLGQARVADERQVNSDMTPEDFNVIGVGCDVSSELSVQRAFEQVMDTFGRVDSVVASAGK